MRTGAAVVFLLLLTAIPGYAVKENFHNTADCLFCHDEIPRFGIDTRETVDFWRYEADDPKLCYNCHKPEENLHPTEVVPGPDALSTVTPELLPLGTSADFKGKVVCISCHFIHASNSDNALLRGFAGSQQPDIFIKWIDLCRQCHGEGLEKRTPHAGDERSCSFCHLGRPQEGEPVNIAPKGKTLCNFCHGVVQEGHYKRVNPYKEVSDCDTCHDPHLGPEYPARLRPGYFDPFKDSVSIDPHYRRTFCFACHKLEKDYPLLDEDREELCTRCHGTEEVVGDIHPLSIVPKLMKIPEGWPLRNGRLTCETCHLAGHPEDRSKYMFLRGEQSESRNAFCFNCHNREEYSGVNPHELIPQLEGCGYCHLKTPVFGKDNARTVEMIADTNILCLRCHDEPPHPANTEHVVSIPRERAATIPLLLPLDRYSRITCATCHNPHLPDTGNSRLRISLPSICVDCHNT